MQLQIVRLRREVVEQDHGALPTGEEMLQGEDLTAIAQGALRQQPQLGKAVEYDATWVEFRDLVEHELGRFAQLHFGGMQDGQLTGRVQRGFRRHEFEYIDASKGPAVALGDQAQLSLGLGKSNVENPLAAARTFEKKLKCYCRLAGAWTPFIEVHAIGIEAATQDVV